MQKHYRWYIEVYEKSSDALVTDYVLQDFSVEKLNSLLGMNLSAPPADMLPLSAESARILLDHAASKPSLELADYECFLAYLQE